MELQIGYHVASGRAAETLFMTSLDRLVANLEHAGLRVGHVAPESRAAVLGVPGVDEPRLRAALADLPLLPGPIREGRLVRVELDDKYAAPAEDAALQQTAATVRARLESAGYAPGRTTLVTLDAHARELVLRLPLVDDKEQRRLEDTVERAPLPVPLTRAFERVVPRR